MFIEHNRNMHSMCLCVSFRLLNERKETRVSEQMHAFNLVALFIRLLLFLLFEPHLILYTLSTYSKGHAISIVMAHENCLCNVVVCTLFFLFA